MAAAAAQQNATRVSAAVSKLPLPGNGNHEGFQIIKIEIDVNPGANIGDE